MDGEGSDASGTNAKTHAADVGVPRAAPEQDCGLPRTSCSISERASAGRSDDEREDVLWLPCHQLELGC